MQTQQVSALPGNIASAVRIITAPSLRFCMRVSRHLRISLLGVLLACQFVATAAMSPLASALLAVPEQGAWRQSGRGMRAPVVTLDTMARVNSAEMPPEPAASVVEMAAVATAMELPLVIICCDPGLNPYQPNHRIMTPRMNSDVLWPGMLLACAHAASR